jgi:hypothetical protein
LAAAASLLVGGRILATRRAIEHAASLTFVGSIGETLAGGGTSPRHLRSGENLVRDPGEIESADDGSAELANAAGLGLHLGSATRVSLSGLLGSEGKNRVELRQGSLTCTVPHLGEGQHFSVATPDARVVVHGTVFSVQVDSKQTIGSQTCVRVTDGVVIVQHGSSETALNAGDSWGCERSASKATEVPASDTATESDPSVVDAAHGTLHSSQRTVDHGTLGEENRLFQAALAAERLGQKTGAELDLNRLLSKYPSSPLGPEARRALSRITGVTPGK